MNLIDKLLATNAKKFNEKRTGKFEVKRISEIIGEKFEVTLQEIGTQEYQSIQMEILDRKGRPNYEKTYDINCKVLLKGVIDPDLKDERLQKHFGAADPLDMVKILFKGDDMTDAVETIAGLSGFSFDEKEEKEQDEEIKN
ncbi:phage tail assembly chaperone [Anaerocolumna jejuensis]|uniref:phage tail assembly chaperone n=1 Tax=Anaerocolumna jejuensis TaxID=259063 RepID=UPI003F7BBA0A